MRSKFNLLVLEDDKIHQKELKNIFEKESLDKYNIYLSKTLEEFQKLLTLRYYLGMSLDQKVPLNDKEGAKKYDISVIDKLNQYQPIGLKSVYTAFPEWDSAKSFGAKIDYASKKEFSTDRWVTQMYDILKEYKTFTPINKDIYNDGINELFSPFVVLINSIMKDSENTEHYKKLFLFSIEMFWAIFCAIQENKKLKNPLDLASKLMYMKDNSLDKEGIFKQELSKVLESEFLEDMLEFNAILNRAECDFTKNEDCEDYMALLLLKLNFFASNHFAINMKVSRNYLRQKEVAIEKIEDKPFVTKEYITYFDELPKDTKSLHLVVKDYEGKSHFLDLGEYLSIELGEMNGNVTVYSKVEDKQLFPVGE